MKKAPTADQKKAADPHHSVWVAANAGSGKTQVLVDRVIRLLLEGAPPDTILCLTYTKAAAAEMSQRLFDRLASWAGLSDEALDETLQILGVTGKDQNTRAKARKLFAMALETPGGLKIQTIHAFCERLLRLFPVESGMSPGFRVIEDLEAQELFHSTLRNALLATDAFTKSAWHFLDSAEIANFDELQKLARSMLSGSTGMRKIFNNATEVANLEQRLRRCLGVTSTRSIEEIEAEICDIDEKSYRAAIAALVPLEADAKPSAPKCLQLALDASSNAQRLEALCDLFLNQEKKARVSIIRVDAKKTEPRHAAWLESERQRVLALLDELSLQQVFQTNLTLYRAIAATAVRIEAEKQARGLYDFDDLIDRTQALLSTSAAARWVLYKLDRGLTHILVDEAQDTSPAQWEIITAFAREFFSKELDRSQKRTIFAVGDIKQSIFSFQGADIKAFEAARRQFDTMARENRDALSVVDLTISYRSNQQVLDIVDHVFAPGSRARRGFGARAEFERPHATSKPNQIGRVELWDTEKTEETDEQDNWRRPVDEPATNHPRFKLSRRIATEIKSWINNRLIAGTDKPVTPGDILILFQKRGPMFHAVLSALRLSSVPVAGADRLKLQSSLIVQDLLALGKFVRLPEDDHALACVLKSPLMPQPVSEDELFELAHGRGEVSLYARLKPGSENQQMLQSVLDTQQTPFMLFSELLQKAAPLIMQRLGQEAEDAAQEFLTLALSYEQQSGTSLMGFLDWFAQGETQIKREMEQAGGAVRLMTVHGSKGLQAPIVFLADAAYVAGASKDKLVAGAVNEGEGPLFVFKARTAKVVESLSQLNEIEKERLAQERLRLLYVGMTRAADELYICGTLQGNRNSPPKESWYATVAETFDKLSEAGRVSQLSHGDGLGIRRFGAAPERTTAPEATKQVEPVPLPDWALAPIPPAQPRKILTASHVSPSFDRQAAQRGLAIHKLAEVMGEAEIEERVSVGARWASRLKIENSIVERLAAIMAGPVVSGVFGRTGQSEVSVGGTVTGLGMVSGRIDRIAITPDEITILDYKTDREPPRILTRNHAYVVQLARYSALLKQAYPDHRIRAGLLWTESADISWLAPALLSQALEPLLEELA